MGIIKKALEDLNAQRKRWVDLLPLYETLEEGKD
jgi:hypothetical protein